MPYVPDHLPAVAKVGGPISAINLLVFDSFGSSALDGGKHHAAMDVSQVYAIAAGGIFAALTILRFCLNMWKMTQSMISLFCHHLLYPLFLHRHRFVGPWSRWGFIVRVLYLAANILCSGFRIKSIAGASDRTAVLALLNTIPLFFGPHLGFLATAMNLSLQSYQIMHASSATMSVLLSSAHALLSCYSRGAPRAVHSLSHNANASPLYGLIVRIAPSKVFPPHSC